MGGSFSQEEPCTSGKISGAEVPPAPAPPPKTNGKNSRAEVPPAPAPAPAPAPPPKTNGKNSGAEVPPAPAPSSNINVNKPPTVGGGKKRKARKGLKKSRKLANRRH